MKRENSVDESLETETEEQSSRKKAKACPALNLEDLGAGYNLTDKRVEKAIQFYENKLLPYISENTRLFESSNFLTLKGYATGLSSVQQRNKSPTSSASKA